MRRIIGKYAGLLLIAVMVAGFCKPINANACFLFYAGGDMTDDGDNIFARDEENFADDNKIYFISPSGRFKKGEVCTGCSDFRWVFTHDSYKYTACNDGWYSGTCLTCGNTKEHVANESVGTNEHGVTVTATVSLNANKRIQEMDPYTANGITESVMPTILLSEVSSAREGVELLASIYDSAGAGVEGSGVLIGDKNEQWYMENISGHEYIALLLPKNITFMQFTTSVIGKIDLDDTEHVIASDHLISVAKSAGTFVGDESENIIDFRASFDDYLMEIDDGASWAIEWTKVTKERLAFNLNYLEKTTKWNVDNVLVDNPLVITNLDDEGKIVPFHNNLALKRTFSIENVIELFRQSPNSDDEIVNFHIFAFHPDGWDKSYIGTMSVFTNMLISGDFDEKDIALADYNMQKLQQEFFTRFESLSGELKAETSLAVREKTMTDACMEMAKQVHDLALALYHYYKSGENSELISFEGSERP